MLNHTTLGAAVRQFALEAREGVLPHVSIGYQFMLDNPECFSAGDTADMARRTAGGLRMNTTQEIWPGNTVDLQMVCSVEYAEAVAAGVAASGVQITERVIVRAMMGEFVLRGAAMDDYRRISAMVIEAKADPPTTEARLLFVARELKELGDMGHHGLLDFIQGDVLDDIWNDNLDRAIAKLTGNYEPPDGDPREGPICDNN